MADSVATINVFAYPKGVDNTQRLHIVRGTISLTPGHYPNNGFPLTWTTLEQIKAIPLSGQANVAPIDMDIHSASLPPSGLIYIWDNVSGNMHVFVSNNGVSSNSGPLIEIGAAAIPGWLLNDVIQFTAYFVRE